MVEQRTVSRAVQVYSRDEQQGVQSNAFQKERDEAIAVSPLIERIDISLLWTAYKIFASASDRRVRIGGMLFLAYLLRTCIVLQLSLFPGSEVGNVAKIVIPNIRAMCGSRARKQLSGWPLCYDTTLKYFRLLIAARVLITRANEPGVYYMPLDTYALFPEQATQHFEILATARPKVSRSLALQRATYHCTLPQEAEISQTLPQRTGVQSEPQLVDSSFVDTQVVSQAVHDLCAAISRVQQVDFLPSTMREIARVFAVHLSAATQKTDLRSVEGPNPTRRQTRRERGTPSADARPKVYHSTDESTSTSVPQADRSPVVDPHLPVSASRFPGNEPESTNGEKGLPTSSQLVDPSRACVTEFSIITRNINSFSENTITDNARVHENETRKSTIVAPKHTQVDSDHPEQPTIAATRELSHSLDRQWDVHSLQWRFPEEDTVFTTTAMATMHLAALLSQRFNADDSRIGHYATLLKQQPELLDLAIVDGLVRSSFPDAKHHVDRLGGPWVTQQYKAYQSGAKQPEAEIHAWANTTYTYDEIERVLTDVGHWQDVQGMPARKRPLPQEVIVDAEQLVDFWECGGAFELRRRGLLYVEVDGHLMSCEQYEDVRLRTLREVLAEPSHHSAETERDIESYLSWIEPWICDAEHEAELLAHLPTKLTYHVSQLREMLDPEQYEVEVGITPMSRRRVIEISLRHAPDQQWILFSQKDIQAFVNWYFSEGEYLAQANGDLEVSGQVEQEDITGEQLALLAQGEPTDEHRPELQCEPDKAVEADLVIGLYAITFDALGATVTNRKTREQRRLDDLEATTATDLLRSHPELIRDLTQNAEVFVEHAFQARRESARQSGDEAKLLVR